MEFGALVSFDFKNEFIVFYLILKKNVYGFYFVLFILLQYFALFVTFLEWKIKNMYGQLEIINILMLVDLVLLR